MARRSAEKDPVKVAAGKKGGRPVTVNAVEQWAMRVDPEWHARVLEKAAEWGVSGSELVRKMVEMGMVGDMLERPEPGETFEQRMEKYRKRRGR